MRGCRRRASAAWPPCAPTAARTSWRAASPCPAIACGTAVDAKPKATSRLQRLANVRAHPRASLLVDHYEEDWDALWWVRVDGAAAVLEDGAEHEEAVAALVAKYRQYTTAVPRGAVIAIAIERWSGWSAR